MPLHPWLTATTQAALDFLLPRACAACDRPVGDGEGLVCGPCWATLPTLPHPQCPRCGHPPEAATGVAPLTRCPFCPQLPPFVRNARSVCWVPHPVSSPILEALKYHGWHAVAAEAGARMARVPFAPDVVRERAAVVPVPLHPDKRRERGSNQAEGLARAVAAAWGVPCWPQVVRRARATRTQARLTATERMANVQDAFDVPPEAAALVRRQHLVLVDDVLTTGATLTSCATALFAAGARTLSYLTFGRAHLTPGR